MSKPVHTLKDYLVPRHKEGCNIYQNRGMSALAAHVMDQVVGPPKCDCGLAEVLKR